MYNFISSSEEGREDHRTGVSFRFCISKTWSDSPGFNRTRSSDIVQTWTSGTEWYVQRFVQPAASCTQMFSWSESGSKCEQASLDPLRTERKHLKNSWREHHERFISQPGVAGASATLDLVGCCWCSWCYEHGSRRSWKKPEERRRRWRWRRRRGQEKKVPPNPTRAVQLHLHPAGAGWMSGTDVKHRLWGLSWRGECRSKRLAIDVRRVVGSETATSGEHNGEQHAMVTEGKRRTVFFSLFPCFVVYLSITSLLYRRVEEDKAV